MHPLPTQAVYRPTSRRTRQSKRRYCGDWEVGVELRHLRIAVTLAPIRRTSFEMMGSTMDFNVGFLKEGFMSFLALFLEITLAA